jgi:hypothetical protein
VKANNVFINWETENDQILVKKVQLADIEDAAMLEPGSDIVGLQAGNQMWRSPEAHCMARVNKPSDIVVSQARSPVEASIDE